MSDKTAMTDEQHRAWCEDPACLHRCHFRPKKLKAHEKPKHCKLCNLPEDDARVPFECPSVPKPIRDRRVAEREAGLVVGDGKMSFGGVVLIKAQRAPLPWGLGGPVVKDGRA